LNDRFESDGFAYTAAPIRVSIGAIFFTRKFWNEMGWFTVHRNNSDMGNDEEEICNFCISNSKAIIVFENVVVGHLSFGKQNSDMKKYYKEHIKLFAVK
jgi:hypothetical protein